MATRNMWVGDTAPDLRLQITDLTGILDLSAAHALTVVAIAPHAEFTGTATAVTPPLQDPSGVSYNVTYPYASGDLAVAGLYQVFLVITYSLGTPNKIETVLITDTLTVNALPTHT